VGRCKEDADDHLPISGKDGRRQKENGIRTEPDGGRRFFGETKGLEARGFHLHGSQRSKRNQASSFVFKEG